MANLSGQKSELSMTIQIKRAATGEVEEHVLKSIVTEDELEKLKEEFPDIKEIK